MGSPKESLEEKNIFAEKYDEIGRLDGTNILSYVDNTPMDINLRLSRRIFDQNQRKKQIPNHLSQYTLRKGKKHITLLSL
jgi:hypothetical protein